MGQRILTLATQGANGTLGDKERDAIQVELKQLIKAIDSIGSRTNFSLNNLLDGSKTDGFTIQVSNSAEDTLTLDASAFQDIRSTDGLAHAMSVTIIGSVDNGEEPSSMSQDDFSQLQTDAATFINDIDAQRSLLGAYQNQMGYDLSNITELSTNLQAARSRVQDTDYAAETAKLTKGQILQQAATAMLAQANQMPNVILTLLK